MDNYKRMLIDLVNKYRDTLVNSSDYIVCYGLLDKINDSIKMIEDEMSKNNGNEDINVNLFVEKIRNLSEEEKNIFTLDNSKRFIQSTNIDLSRMHVRLRTILNNINRLSDDLLNNSKLVEIEKQKNELERLYNIVDEEIFSDNYKLVLDFIQLCYEDQMISLNDNIELNFYMLRKINGYTRELETDVVIVDENIESEEDIRNRLEEIFAKYGYTYDKSKFISKKLDVKFIKYVRLDYVDYVLSMFKKYDIDESLLYERLMTFYKIVMDNDKEVFNSVLSFVDNHNCSLKSLLSVPAIFAKRKRKFVSRNIGNIDGGDSIIEVAGANSDFFSNIELYKNLTGKNVIEDEDINHLGIYLSTPSSLVLKNLSILRKYGIVSEGKFPNTVTSLCGRDCEYLIDRFVETGIFEKCLQPRTNRFGTLMEPRSTNILGRNSDPFTFYKIKRAGDLGEDVLASNGGIRRILTNNTSDYMGLKVRNDIDGELSIVQDVLSLDTMDSISGNIRKFLPNDIHKYTDEENRRLVEFRNLFEYKTFSPVNIFEASDREMKTKLKGEFIEKIFTCDYEKVMTKEEFSDVLDDEFIKLLDNSVKISDVAYQFSHPSLPNHNVIVSRYKVLRLCKLLKDNGCWIVNNSTDIDKENTLLSVAIKDTIVCETEMVLLRFSIRKLLSKGYEYSANTNGYGRGAR